MYKRIYERYQTLSKGDKAELKRCNLARLKDSPAYFRILKYTGMKDNDQTQRVLYLLAGLDITSSQDEQSFSVATAMLNAGVKERQIIQITRSGNNGIEYLKRQLSRCKKIDLESIGKLAQFWGDNARRNLLKNFIVAQNN
jgi:CRISPR system Cascade subunit CasB